MVQKHWTFKLPKDIATSPITPKKLQFCVTFSGKSREIFKMSNVQIFPTPVPNHSSLTTHIHFVVRHHNGSETMWLPAHLWENLIMHSPGPNFSEVVWDAKTTLTNIKLLNLLRTVYKCPNCCLRISCSQDHQQKLYNSVSVVQAIFI